ncbi:MAG: hypothetical protein GEU91_18460 [Rhizobiales bacterium]|nr:hypothetical protein [Hyphomicrobiales bacterium]
MARLLGWIDGVGFVSRQPLTGPRTVGSAATESIGGFVQTVASAFGAWRWSFNVQPMNGRLFRLFRGMVTALHGGANAVRVPFDDPDIMSWAESGVDTTPAEIRAGVPWSNGASWSNGENWGVGRPWVGIFGNHVKGDDTIRLNNQHWGRDLVGGEWIGFVPFHFGLYIITERIDDVGNYRIWPPLRKALTATDFATLTPIMVMRLESEAAATAGRGVAVADGNSLTMVEVEDSDVRDYFSE